MKTRTLAAHILYFRRLKPSIPMFQPESSVGCALLKTKQINFVFETKIKKIGGETGEKNPTTPRSEIPSDNPQGSHIRSQSAPSTIVMS
jgi:hypothetical protein